jgi:5-methylcytosine-specific restriction endonuclease McrA
MQSVLDQKCLVLNRAWQAIDQRTVQEAILQLSAGAATALDIEGEDNIRPVRWEEWITLPIRNGDDVIHTARRSIRVPTVIVAVNYAQVPKKRPKLSLRGVAERDGGRCQYTGKQLTREEMTLDHVLPRSKGGRDEWGNLVLAHKQVNHRKGNRLNHEAGLKLIRAPFEPVAVPVSATIRPAHPHHEIFLRRT